MLKSHTSVTVGIVKGYEPSYKGLKLFCEVSIDVRISYEPSY